VTGADVEALLRPIIWVVEQDLLAFSSRLRALFFSTPLFPLEPGTVTSSEFFPSLETFPQFKRFPPSPVLSDCPSRFPLAPLFLQSQLPVGGNWVLTTHSPCEDNNHIRRYLDSLPIFALPFLTGYPPLFPFFSSFSRAGRRRQRNPLFIFFFCRSWGLVVFAAMAAFSAYLCPFTGTTPPLFFLSVGPVVKETPGPFYFFLPGPASWLCQLRSPRATVYKQHFFFLCPPSVQRFSDNFFVSSLPPQSPITPSPLLKPMTSVTPRFPSSVSDNNPRTNSPFPSYSFRELPLPPFFPRPLIKPALDRVFFFSPRNFLRGGSAGIAWRQSFFFFFSTDGFTAYPPFSPLL